MTKHPFDSHETWLMMFDPAATGEQLRQHRLAHHYTQENLSFTFADGGLPVSRAAIIGWEKGNKTPRLDHVVFLAELYNCPIDELVISCRRSRMGTDEADDQLVSFLPVLRWRSYCRISLISKWSRAAKGRWRHRKSYLKRRFSPQQRKDNSLHHSV